MDILLENKNTFAKDLNEKQITIPVTKYGDRCSNSYGHVVQKEKKSFRLMVRRYTYDAGEEINSFVCLEDLVRITRGRLYA